MKGGGAGSYPSLCIAPVVLSLFVVHYVHTYVDATAGILSSLVCCLAIYSSIPFLRPDISEAVEALGLLFLYTLLISSLPWFFFRQEFLIPAVYSVVLALCFAYIHSKKIPSGRWFGSLGPNPLKCALLGTLLGIPTGVVEYFILRLPPPSPTFSFSYFLQTVIYMLVFVSLGEEVLFRGLIQTSLEDIYGFRIGIVLNAVVFAIMYISWRNVVKVIFVFLAGLLLGYLFKKRGSLVAPISLHTTNNIILLAVVPFLA